MSTTEAATGAEVDLWQQAYGQLSPQVREKWALEQIKTIRNTVAKDLTPAEFQMGMAIAAKYDLDPLLKEIWFAKGNPKDGEPGQLLMMVGRDGLLRNARRDDGFAGMDGDVHRKNDVFKVDRLPNGEREITHSYEGGDKARGEILGAWAQVFVRGRGTVYFYAPWDEYAPTRYNRAWKQTPSVMILKCAQSLCLRLAFNLSGVVGEDEGARAYESMQDAPPTSEQESLSQLVADHVPAKFRDTFWEVWGTAADLRPGQLSVAGVSMAIGGQPDEVVHDWLREQAVLNLKATEARDEAEVTDAEVVDDVDVLMRRLSDLTDSLDSGELTEEQEAEVVSEIAQVEERIVRAGGELPGAVNE